MDETEGQRRRLPPWMLGVAAAKSEIKEEIDTVINQENKCAGSPNRQIKSRARRAARLEKETLVPHKEDLDPDSDSHGSSLLVKRESKKTKRKVLKKEVKCDGNTRETKESSDFGESSLAVKYESKRTKRKIGTQEEIRDDEVGTRNKESAPKKRQRTKKPSENSCEESEDPSSNEDDEDLTMEDLMSIAKEFVEGDNNDEIQQPSDIEKQKPQTEFADVNDHTKETINEEADSHQNSAEICSTTTGDPAQDMLDLLLGPLLTNNPLENDNKKVELITDNMRLAHHSKMQKQRDVCVEKPVVPLMKKKSSLRDKVAAFLD